MKSQFLRQGLVVPKYLLLLGAAFGILLFAVTNVSSASWTPRPSEKLAFQLVDSGLNEPGLVAAISGDASRLFVTERAGTIRVVRNDSLLATPFLDLSSKVASFSVGSGFNLFTPPIIERVGLMALSFPPDYLDSGYFFVLYITEPDSILLLERYQVSSNPDSADPASGQTVLSIPITAYLAAPAREHFDQHSMTFGRDSLLYIAFGDNNEELVGFSVINRGPQSLLSHLLRIDVRSLPYTIPSNNPYAASQDTLGEILQLGIFASPRHMAIDNSNGKIFIVDDLSTGFANPRYIYQLEEDSSVLKMHHVYYDGEQHAVATVTSAPYFGSSIPTLDDRLFVATAPFPQSLRPTVLFMNTYGIGSETKHYSLLKYAVDSFEVTVHDQGLPTPDRTFKTGVFNDANGEIVTLEGNSLKRLVSVPCCLGTRGNVDCSSDDGVDIADLTLFVDHLFGSFPPLCCPEEGNVDGIGGIDIGDLTRLVDHLFISFQPTASCQ